MSTQRNTIASTLAIVCASFLIVASVAQTVQVQKPLRATPNEPYRYGVLAHPFPFSLGGPTVDKQIDLMAQAGVRFVRIDYCGAQIEPTQGTWDWSVEDRVAQKLAARGITELPIVNQYCAPKWATGGHGYPEIWDDPSLYAAFAGAIAAHVHANFPKITRIELFNEPNLSGWWRTHNPAYAVHDGSATAQYMRAAYAAIKQNASGMTVVGPALADGGTMVVDPRKFLEGMYAAGCRHGICWDVLSVHNYRWVNPAVAMPHGAPNRFDIYKDLLAICDQHGDVGTHVMLTEWGFSTDPNSRDGVDQQTQAAYVSIGLNLMLADPRVDGVVYVNIYNPGNDFWAHTALVNPDFTPKPAYYVYRSFALAR